MEFGYEARVNHVAKGEKKDWGVAFGAQRSWLGSFDTIKDV